MTELEGLRWIEELARGRRWLVGISVHPNGRYYVSTWEVRPGFRPAGVEPVEARDVPTGECLYAAAGKNLTEALVELRARVEGKAA